MAGHSHDDHHVNEQKPVSFTVPFILAAVTLIIIFLFLSLCDPKKHDAHDAHHGTENPAHADFKGGEHNEKHQDEGPKAGQNVSGEAAGSEQHEAAPAQGSDPHTQETPAAEHH